MLKTKQIQTILTAIGLIGLVGVGAACDSDQKNGGESGEKAQAESVEGSKAGDEAEGESDENTTMPDEVVFAFQPQENPEALAPDADELASYMTDKIGVKSKVFLPTSYAAVVEALRAENADVAYFSGWPYLIASQKADVELLVVEERRGNPFYHSQWYVKQDSDIKTVADLEGKDVAFTSPTSTSGYLFPVAKVIEDGPLEEGGDPKKFFGEITFAGGYEQSLLALVNGRVDASAASDYSYEQYLTDEQRENIRILSKQGPVPTHGIAVRSALPDALKAKIKQAFLDLNKEENNELLSSIYGAEKLVERTHEEHVAPLAKALKLVGEEKDIEGFGAGSGSGSGSGHGSAEGSGKGSGSGKAKGHDEGSGEGSGSGSGSGEEHGHEHGSGEGSGH